MSQEIEHDSRAIKYLVEKELLPFLGHIRPVDRSAFAVLYTEALTCPDGQGNPIDQYMVTWLDRELLASTNLDGKRANQLTEVLAGIKEKARSPSQEIDARFDNSNWKEG